MGVYKRSNASTRYVRVTNYVSRFLFCPLTKNQKRYLSFRLLFSNISTNQRYFYKEEKKVLAIN